VDKGNTEISWTSLMPTSDYSITMRYWYEWVSMSLYGASFYFLFRSGYSYSKTFIKSRSSYLLFILFNHIFWVGFVACKLCGHFGIYDNELGGFTSLFQMMGSLCAVMNTLQFILSAQKVTRAYSLIAYGFTFVLHITMNWNNYTRFFPVGHIFTRDLVSVITKVNLAWLVMMFVFDCVPPIFVIYRLMHGYDCSWKLKFKAVWNHDPWFILIFEAQFLCLVLFITQEQLRNNSEVLGHERVWLAFHGVDTFCQALFAVLNTKLVEIMVKALKSKSLAINLTKVTKTLKTKSIPQEITTK
jgi:hypothetical protein